MERQKVSSSNISSIGYHAETQTLEIEFLNGAIYQYFDVPKHVFEELMRAPSHGQYLAKYIKGYYRFARV